MDVLPTRGTPTMTMEQMFYGSITLVVMLLGIIGKMGWHWVRNREKAVQLEERDKKLQEQEMSLVKERITRVEAHGESLKEGRQHFKDLDNKTESLEKHKLDRSEFDRYCVTNEREHARIELGIDKLGERIDTLANKFDDMREDWKQHAARVEGQAAAITNIAAKVVNREVLGSEK